MQGCPDKLKQLREYLGDACDDAVPDVLDGRREAEPNLLQIHQATQPDDLEPLKGDLTSQSGTTPGDRVRDPLPSRRKGAGQEGRRVLPDFRELNKSKRATGDSSNQQARWRDGSR